jgi:glutamate dehydrogenase (NAD(P)+)
VAAEVAEEFCDVRLDGAQIAIQGFGAVGKHAARFLVEKGAKLVAVSDSRGTVIDPNGLALEQLLELKADGKSVTELAGAPTGDGQAIIATQCDILIPAARPDILNGTNAKDVKAKLIVQGANIPSTVEAEEILHQRGIVVIPDFIANAGGVICAAVEFHGGSQTQAMVTIGDKIRRNTKEVLEQARNGALSPRRAAEALARNRVHQAMALKRSF